MPRKGRHSDGGRKKKKKNFMGKRRAMKKKKKKHKKRKCMNIILSNGNENFSQELPIQMTTFFKRTLVWPKYSLP